MDKTKLIWLGWELIRATDEYKLYLFRYPAWKSVTGKYRLMWAGKFKAEGTKKHVEQFIPQDKEAGE